MGNVRLQITMKANGSVEVNGPIDNAMLCYGLLEVAKDIVRTRVQEKAERPTIIPVQILPGNGRV